MHPVSIWPQKTARNEDLLLDVTTSGNSIINIVNVANKEFKQPGGSVAFLPHNRINEQSAFLGLKFMGKHTLTQFNLAAYK